MYKEINTYCEAYERLGISETAFKAVCKFENELEPVFSHIEAVGFINQARVLKAFHDNQVAAHYFSPTTGYGYDDIGRDNLDKVFASALDAEAAIVSPQIVSGTHAIFTVLSGLLRPGDTMLSVTGRPYDTLMDAIGIDGSVPCSLHESKIGYEQVDLGLDGSFDINRIGMRVEELQPRIAYFQRSRGYAWREAIHPESMKPIFETIKRLSPDTIIVVDNCYGEFTSTEEPCALGADVIVGSLIKNLGGGLAPTGGYFAGKKEYIHRIANRLTVPGMGREVGSYFGSYLPFYQGLFNAPHVVSQSLKTAALFARAFESLELSTMPASDAERSDIVQALRFKTKDDLIAFCGCIQASSPIDGYVIPEPWAMPGYQSEVIMAAGTFIQGASIELTADAPICEPYTAYVQGALSYAHGRLAVMRAFGRLMANTKA